MAVPCDVIGCRRPAEWKRPATLLSNFSEHLCEPHYEALSLTHPYRAGQYERLPDGIERDSTALRGSSMFLQTIPSL